MLYLDTCDDTVSFNFWNFSCVWRLAGRHTAGPILTLIITSSSRINQQYCWRQKTDRYSSRAGAARRGAGGVAFARCGAWGRAVGVAGTFVCGAASTTVQQPCFEHRKR